MIHVLEYLWSAAWCFFDEGDPAAEDGCATEPSPSWKEGPKTWPPAYDDVRAPNTSNQPAATTLTPAPATSPTRPRTWTTPRHSRQGWPIATGVIEGACRHICKDRMDITGARWGIDGAEAVLKLRTVRSNGDFDEYFAFHLARERERVHASCYTGNVIPVAA